MTEQGYQRQRAWLETKEIVITTAREFVKEPNSINLRALVTAVDALDWLERGPQTKDADAAGSAP